MRFVEGCSLAALIREARSDRSRTITRRLERRHASALQAAEASPMPTSWGSSIATSSRQTSWSTRRGHLWVADFGLARFLDGGDLTRPAT